MAKKRNRITAAMSQTIADTSPLIKKTTILAIQEDATNKIQHIQLNLLKMNPFQPRININMHSLNELISSIEQNGLLQPIVITEKDSHNKYTIIAGHRRYEAHRIMGKESINAMIIKDIKEKDLAVLSLTENLMRENLHPIENAIAMKNILDNNIVESQNKLAEYLGLSKGYISKLMNVLKLPSSIIKLVKTENYKDINILVLLNKLPSESNMHEVYQSVKNLTRSEAEKFIKALYSTPIKKEILNIKTTKTTINMSLNLKQLSNEQITIIEKKLEEIEKITQEWTK